MNIDWSIVATIGTPIVTLFIGAWVNRRFERRPKLVTHYGSVSAFKQKKPLGNVSDIYTHTVVVKNDGLRSATNVRLSHSVLPDFNIYPSIEYKIETLPDGSKDIVIPRLVPNEEITIAYLYAPPLRYDQINGNIKSDEGFAKVISVLLQRQYPAWFNFIVAIILLFGIVSILYLVYEGILRLF